MQDIAFPDPIDLRSDTVTKPDQAMRAAMAAADVGDEFYSEDPTVRRLERTAAELFGVEEAMLTVSGTSANLISVMSTTSEHGGAVLVPADSDIATWESHTFALLAGSPVVSLPAEGGVVDSTALEAALHPESGAPQPGVVVAENAHSASGGTPLSLTAVRTLERVAAGVGVPFAVDGARVLDACLAGGYEPNELAALTDSVTLSLYKNLGAPFGSLVLGSADLVGLARRIRRLIGVTFRQVGVFAAAGIVALDRWRELAVDHERASALAGDLVAELDADAVTWRGTNTVLVRPTGDPKEAVAELQRRGVLVRRFDSEKLRLVVHRDLADADLERAGKLVADVCAGAPAASKASTVQVPPPAARLWFLQQLDETSNAYNLQFAGHVDGIEPQRLRRALGEVAARHEPLRTAYTTDDAGAPQAILQPPGEIDLRTVQPQQEGAPDEIARELARAELAKPFDLRSVPVRYLAADLGDGSWLVCVTVHHIAFDGWSTSLFARELDATYRGESLGVTPEPGFHVVANAQADEAATREHELSAFWRDELAGLEDLWLPQPAGGPTGEQALHEVRLHPDTVAGVNALASACDTTVYTVLVTAYHVVLARYSGQWDFCTGTPVNGREDGQARDLIGCFVNTLCIRSAVGQRIGMREAVQRSRQRLVAAYRHQQLPFDDVVRILRPGRGTGYPLFRAFCSAVHSAAEPLRLGDRPFRPIVPKYPSARFDLDVTFDIGSKSISYVLTHDTGCIGVSSGAGIARHLEAVLDWGVAQPELPVGELPLLMPDEQDRVLEVLNG